ncbi:MAG: hypothetical protein HOL07_16360 [Rhodospirillaceae bacterium]|jgi:hypothetical protein|nr:hypothetical protein [Rhodospirillaceae bacterium]MBT4773469.1 hypothetical protein [Rhodospirillaceae bacterium]MBT5359915.1 hypothetical protein [Rhodospirillaceae bacterium]MBT5769442.1 hypothetical protein [Rhodospirillaceae bacterium]MBT6310204.1 hypothetical protein [Rhodospirillaceae bacterium]
MIRRPLWKWLPIGVIVALGVVGAFLIGVSYLTGQIFPGNFVTKSLWAFLVFAIFLAPIGAVILSLLCVSHRNRGYARFWDFYWFCAWFGLLYLGFWTIVWLGLSQGNQYVLGASLIGGVPSVLACSFLFGICVLDRQNENAIEQVEGVGARGSD